jgi:cell division protein FtsB
VLLKNQLTYYRSWVGFKDWEWARLFNKVKPLLKRRNFEKEIDERNKRIAELQSQMEKDTKSKKDLETAIADLDSQVKDLTGKLKKERDSIADLQVTLFSVTPIQLERMTKNCFMMKRLKWKRRLKSYKVNWMTSMQISTIWKRTSRTQSAN